MAGSNNYYGAGASDYWLSFTAPDGYALYINGQRSTLITRTGLGGTAFDENAEVELRPVAGGGRLDFGTFTGISVGESITWEIGLGGFPLEGRSAGRIVFREFDLMYYPMHVDRLYYTAPDSYGFTQTIYNYPGSQTLRQVKVPQGIVDFVQESNGYSIRFYASGQFNIVTSLYEFSVAPWKTIQVEATNSLLKITETEGGVSRVSRLELTSGSVASGNYQWTLQEGQTGSTWLRTATYTSVNGVLDNGISGREMTVVANPGGQSGIPAAKTLYRFENKGWGEELVKVVANPDSPTGALTTRYDYHTDAPSAGTETHRGSYRRIKSIAFPDGNWTAYQYYDEWNKRGELKHQFEPYLSAPATPGLNAAQGKVTYFEYAADWTGRHTRPTLWRETINGLETGKTTYTHGDVLGGTPEVNWSREYTTALTYRDGGTASSSYSERYRGDAGFDMPFRPYDQRNADQSRTVWAYAGGTFNADKSFTVTGGLPDVRVITVHGSTSSAGAQAVNAWNGQSFASIYLVPNKSVLSAKIYNTFGLLVRSETHVFTGAGFERLTWEDFTYDIAGRLTQQHASNGDIVQFTYVGGRLDHSIAADGSRTNYTYDALGRVLTSTKEGANPRLAELTASYSYQSQGDLTTTYSYDGANRVVSQVVSSGGLSLATSRKYNPAGRLTETSEPGGFVTEYTYSSGGRIVTTKAPGSIPGGPSTLTKTVENHLDGRTKSITGTSVIAEYYDHSIESVTGRRIISHRRVSTNSPAVTTTVVDWHGNPVSVTHPGWNGSPVTKTYSYDPTTGQLAKIVQPGLADQLFTYDSLGRLWREGLDVSTPAGLNDGSEDRITVYISEFEKDGSGHWWAAERRGTYPIANDSTFKVLYDSTTRLTGYSGARRTEVQSVDADGNVTTTTVDRPGAKRVLVATTAPGSSTSAVQVSYNGLLVETRSTAGIVSRHEYDALGRKVRHYDPRITGSPGYSETIYQSGNSNLVSQVKDGAGKAVATYYYHPYGYGLVSAVQDALGYLTRYEYNALGQVVRQFGDATSPHKIVYDDYGRRKELHTFQGGTNWNAATWPTANDGAANITKWVYQEASGLLEYKEDSGANRTTYTYTSAGQVHTRTGQRGIVTTYDYWPKTGELKSVVYSDATTRLDYTYTRMGQINTVSDATGERDFVYDPSRPWRLAAEAHDVFYGQRVQTRLYESGSGGVPEGRYRGFQLGATANSPGELQQTYTYTTSGLFDTLVSNRQNNSAGLARTFDYNYVANSVLVGELTATAANGFRVTREYDPQRSLLKSIGTEWGTGGAAFTQARFDYAHNDRGERISAQMSGAAFADYYTGAPGGYNAVTHYYVYNGKGELQSAALHGGVAVGSPPSNTELPGRRFEYRYDEAGNRTSSGPTGNPNNVDNVYTTNGLNQYTTKENNTLRVSGTAAAAANVAAVGGTVTKSGRAWGAEILPANANNAVLAQILILAASPGAGPGGADLIKSTNRLYFMPKALQAFGYDGDGNLTHDSVWDYAYDAENRLVSMQHRPEVIGSGKISAVDARRLEFKYDYLGRRVQKIVRGGWNGSYYAGSALTYRKYLYDGWNLVAEYNASGTSLALVRSYTWGLDLAGSLTATGGVGALVQIHDYEEGGSGGTTLLPAYDGNGNVVTLMDVATGNIRATYEYSPFGELTRCDGDYAKKNPFRFSTKFHDQETGLIYYGLRYYSPSLGRFINQDPISERGGLNLYAFAGNNGVNRADLLGMAPILVDADPLKRWDTPDGLEPPSSLSADEDWYGSFVSASGDDGLDPFNTYAFYVNGVDMGRLDSHGLADMLFQASQAASAEKEYEKWKASRGKAEVIIGEAVPFNEEENGGVAPDNAGAGTGPKIEEVTITFRPAALPGGSLADTIIGKRHASVKTSQGEFGQGKVGAGVPGQGMEGIAYTLKTEMVDHSGESRQPGVINVRVTVDMNIFLPEVQLGTPKGLWFPAINDCNTILEKAVEKAGGNWDKAYKEYLEQNQKYQDHLLISRGI